MMVLLFVYGSLRSGQPNHGCLAGCKFMGNAMTVPAYRIQDFGAFVGLLSGTLAVEGEVWEVRPHALAKLDYLEAVDAGVFKRTNVNLQSPFDDKTVQAYFYSYEAGLLC